MFSCLPKMRPDIKNQYWLAGTVFLILILLSPNSILAETIILKSGQKLEGNILEKQDKYIKIDFDGVAITYWLDEIDSIDGNKVVEKETQDSPEQNTALKKGAPEDIFIKGSNLLKEGKWDRAISVFLDIISVNPEFAGVNHNLGCAYFAKENYDAAIERFAFSLDSEPTPYSGITNFNIAMCYQMKAMMADKSDSINLDFQEALNLAEEYYKKSLEILPKFPQSHSNLALVYHHQGKPKDAVEKEADLARRLADVLGGFSPDILSRVYSYHSYEACLSIVENYLGLGEAERAEKELNNLINLMKQNPPKDKFIYWSAYNILGYCLFQRKDYDSALKSFKQSLDIEPNQPRADITHSNLGMIYLEKGNLSEAKKEFEKTLKINPDNETAKDYLNKLSDKL